MECLNGLRAISTIWVLWAHVHLQLARGPIANASYILVWIKEYYSMLTVSAFIVVDTFFFISGLLVTWSILRHMEKT